MNYDEIAYRIVQIFLEHGLAGAVALLALYAYWKKDKHIAALYERLLEQQNTVSNAYYSLTKDLDETLDATLDTLQHCTNCPVRPRRRREKP